MPDITTILQFITVSNAIMLFKIVFLVILSIYSLFAIMLLVKIQALNRIVFLPMSTDRGMLRLFAILYFLAILSLFFLTIVIV